MSMCCYESTLHNLLRRLVEQEQEHKQVARARIKEREGVPKKAEEDQPWPVPRPCTWDLCLLYSFPKLHRHIDAIL